MDIGSIVTIITALIGAAGCIIVAVITNSNTRTKVTYELEKQQALIKADIEKNQEMTQFKIDSLAREVSKHNSFASQIPVMQERIDSLSKDITSIEKRLNTIQGG